MGEVVDWSSQMRTTVLQDIVGSTACPTCGEPAGMPCSHLLHHSSFNFYSVHAARRKAAGVPLSKKQRKHQRPSLINKQCSTCGARRGIPCTKWNGQPLADRRFHKYRGKHRPVKKHKKYVMSRELVQQRYAKYEARRLAEKARRTAARS